MSAFSNLYQYYIEMRLIGLCIFAILATAQGIFSDETVLAPQQPVEEHVPELPIENPKLPLDPISRQEPLITPQPTTEIPEEPNQEPNSATLAILESNSSTVPIKEQNIPDAQLQSPESFVLKLDQGEMSLKTVTSLFAKFQFNSAVVVTDSDVKENDDMEKKRIVKLSPIVQSLHLSDRPAFEIKEKLKPEVIVPSPIQKSVVKSRRISYEQLHSLFPISLSNFRKELMGCPDFKFRKVQAARMFWRMKKLQMYSFVLQVTLLKTDKTDSQIISETKKLQKRYLINSLLTLKQRLSALQTSSNPCNIGEDDDYIGDEIDQFDDIDNNIDNASDDAQLGNTNDEPNKYATERREVITAVQNVMKEVYFR